MKINKNASKPKKRSTTMEVVPLLSVAKPKSKNSPTAAQATPIKRPAAPTVPTPAPKEEEVVDANRIPSIDEFLERFRERASSCLENAYLAEHEMIESLDDDTLSSSLCEDVFSLAQIQVELLHEYLLLKEIAKSEAGENLVIVCLLCIIRNLQNLQLQHRDCFLRDLETSCAAANDFMRMIECFDELMASTHRRYPNMEKRKDKAVAGSQMAILEKESDNLVALYGNDAVFAVQRSQIFVMKTIQQSSIPNDLFSRDWEDEFVFNEVVLSIVKTMEDYLFDFHSYLSNAFLYGKIVGALVRSVVCFYVRSLVQKADRIRRRKRNGNRFVGGTVEPPFRNTSRAVLRMMYDMEVFRTYFQNLTKQLPGLDKLVEEELSVLVIIHECLTMTLNESNGGCALEEFIVVLHKRTGANSHVTKFLMQDLWLVAAPPEQRRGLNDNLALMEGELKLLSNKLEEGRRESTASPRPRDKLPGLLLHEVLLELYERRILQENLRPCAPCINIVRKSKAKSAASAGTPRKPSPKSPNTIASMLTNLDFSSLHDNPKFQFFDLPAIIPAFGMGDMPSASSRTASAEPSMVVEERTRTDHERTLTTVRKRLLSNLKLHNIRFVAHKTTKLERRMAEINNGWG